MKIMIALPCMAKVDTPFMMAKDNLLFASLRQKDMYIQIQYIEGSLIYDARNQLATTAIEYDFDRVLWIDSDMTFQPDLLMRLSARLDEGRDYVAALAFRRVPPYLPVIYSHIGKIKNEAGIEIPSLTTYEPYPENDIFEVDGSGFGCVMTSVKILKQCRDAYGLPFSPRLGFGEDVSFCLMCKEQGIKMYCDSSIKVGHLGRITITEDMYKETRRIRDAQIQHNNSSAQ